MSDKKQGRGQTLSPAFVTGAIALVFLAVGYQTALFIHRAASLKLLSDVSVPDTVFVISSDAGGPSGNVPPRSGASSVRGDGPGGSSSGAPHVRYERHRGARPEAADRAAASMMPKVCESFAFDPNTVSVSDLCRLGFSLKQAESIDRYRKKGGRFRRKSDFAKSFVVSDSVFRRLEKYIDIPLLDINSADSAAFDALPGIGGYFASRMVSYRESLGGYSYKEQLMDIYHLDREKFDGFSDLISIGRKPAAFRLWSMPPDSLRMHPYIRSFQTAKAIELYRNNNPRTLWTVDGLRNAGILDNDAASRLSRCLIAEP